MSLSASEASAKPSILNTSTLSVHRVLQVRVTGLTLIVPSYPAPGLRSGVALTAFGVNRVAFVAPEALDLVTLLDTPPHAVRDWRGDIFAGRGSSSEVEDGVLAVRATKADARLLGDLDLDEAVIDGSWLAVLSEGGSWGN